MNTLLLRQESIHIDSSDREMSSAGLLALVIDGHDPALIAAALDVPAATVKNVASLTMRDLLIQAQMYEAASKIFPCTVKRFPAIARWVGDIKQCSWDDFLNQRELIEVLEMRAYFKAFINSTVNLPRSKES